jgi:D-glycero-D-manno-heptose 1,7-bisphosphate phosphatase
MNRAVFLDRDGTLNVETEYLHRPEDVVLYPQAGPALRRLSQAGFKLVIVTNQSGIGRGYYTVADMEAVNARLTAELARMGAPIDRIYFAPEAPDQPSRGRKPSPQLLFDARDEMQLDLAESFMIGDKLIDLECGWNAGVKKSILVRTGYGADYEQENPGLTERAWIVDDLTQAAERICDLKSQI